jgi:cytochrome c oxidase subunit 2
VLLYATLRRRPAEGPLENPRERRDGVLILAVAGGGTFVLLTGLLLASFVTERRVVRAPGPPAVTIEVESHQFWWEVRYPEAQVVTANELRIPAGVPVYLRLSSHDVIHSFWVPELHGKVDMTPGHETHLWLLADRPGVYRGQCAEFCGEQHALMAFLVIAEEPAAYSRWLETARAAGDKAGERVQRGREVFLAARCQLCHGVRGLPTPLERTLAGPDLSDLALRRTLGAATFPNDRENLRRLIVEPRRAKPGIRMPATVLPPEDLEALLDYLATLR